MKTKKSPTPVFALCVRRNNRFTAADIATELPELKSAKLLDAQAGKDRAPD